MQWAVIDGKKRLLVGGKVNRFIPNPTFDPVAKPGHPRRVLPRPQPRAARTSARCSASSSRSIPAYRNRDARLALIDAQGLEGCFLFPTLGVGMEESLKHDPEAAGRRVPTPSTAGCARTGASHYQSRIFAAPYITLVDVDAAVARARVGARAGRARDRDARRRRCAHPHGSRSPADRASTRSGRASPRPASRVAYHSGDTGYHKFAEEWGVGGEFKAFDYDPLRMCLSPSADAATRWRR